MIMSAVSSSQLLESVARSVIVQVAPGAKVAQLELTWKKSTLSVVICPTCMVAVGDVLAS